MFICFFASLLLVTVNDLFAFYLVIELQSFSLYLLVGIKRNSLSGNSASLKYFIYGAFSSCLIILGASLVYGCVGSLSFNDIYLFVEGSSSGYFDLRISFIVGLFLILSGFFFKLGIYPFHG